MNQWKDYWNTQEREPGYQLQTNTELQSPNWQAGDDPNSTPNWQAGDEPDSAPNWQAGA